MILGARDNGEGVTYRAVQGPVLAAFATAVALVNVPRIVNPDPGVPGQRTLGLLFVGLLLVVIVRGLMSSTVRGDAEGLRVRQMMRTRRWHWTEIARVTAVTAQVGVLRHERRVLVVEGTDGHVRRLTEINAKQATGNALSGVDLLAQRLESLRTSDKMAEGASAVP